MAITAILIPAVGDRIGVQCGPGEFARDNQGIVIAVIETRWGSYGVVLMDDGSTCCCDSINSGLGIGWHRV